MIHTPKALATVALLKTRLDAGHDHLGLFEPLVLDALLRSNARDFVAADIRVIITERTGVVMPADAIQTLLGRCAKHGFVERSGGRFFRTQKPVPDPALDSTRAVFHAEQAKLGGAFVDFAAAAGVKLDSADEALTALATFVSDNKVHLILEEPFPDSPLERSSLNRKLTRTIARFITERCLESPELRPALEALIEGMLLQDTLLLRDIPDAAQRFQNLLVVLDTGILFAALDLAGVANGISAKEGLALLREAGARTAAFSSTVDEMRRILAVYEDRIGTTAGRLTLHPTPLTHHVLSNRLSPADVRVISATLESSLRTLGIIVRDVPTHISQFTLNETALAEVLVNAKSDVESPRVRHDVDCIAGVLTLRRGRTATAIERSVAIFSSTSGRVVSTVQRWYFGEGEKGLPPIVHQAALTSIAWLKKPAAAPSLKMHELAALCVAAMRPTRETWKKFVDTLRRMSRDGIISDDETAAIVVSELTEPVLARLDEEFEPDSDSIEQAIERVRDAYRREATAAADIVVGNAKAETALAQSAATQAMARRDEVLGVVEARISRSAGRMANALFSLAIAPLVLVASRVMWKMKMAHSSGWETTNPSPAKATTGGTRRGQAYQEAEAGA